MKLNQANRPCEPSMDYNYGECLHQSIIMKAGCQPHWRLFSVDGMPTCDNISMLNEFEMQMINMKLGMDNEDILRETKCLLPCRFFEYKVCLSAQ